MKNYTIPQIIGEKGIFTDGDWVESKDQDPNGSVRLIQLADIGDGVFLNKSNRRLAKEKALQLRCTFLYKGDILIARMPDPLGRCCVFPGLDEECVTVVDVCIVRIINFVHYNQFVARIINSDAIRAQIKRQSTGTTRTRISRGNLSKIEIPLPPLADQKRIAHLLGKVEGLIARRKEQLQQLDELLKSVFLEMFGDPVRNEKGWEKSPLEIFMKGLPNNGLYKPQSDYGSGTKIVRINSFYDGYVQNIESLKRVKITDNEYERFNVQTNDILINRVNSIEYLGKLGVMPQINEPIVYESNMMRFRLNTNSILPVFLMFIWRTPFIKSQIINRAKKAVNQASINQKDVRSFVIVKPPITLQNQFAAIVEKVESLKSRYQQSLTDLESLYGALSQKAFKGELDLERVPVPAEKETDETEEGNRERDENREIGKEFELPAQA